MKNPLQTLKVLPERISHDTPPVSSKAQLNSSSPSLVRRLYNLIIQKAHTPQAVWTLNLASFTESFISPVPPDLLLIPMILADRTKAWWYAFLCTLSSVLGGFLGYAIGYFLFETGGQWIIQTYHLEQAFTQLQMRFQEWGFWIIVFKGLTPIPFKLVTLTSGMTRLALPQFIVASIIARSVRFFLVAGLLWYFGEWARNFIERYLPWIFASLLIVLIAGFMIVKVLLG